jgi:hypothetical protein
MMTSDELFDQIHQNRIATSKRPDTDPRKQPLTELHSLMQHMVEQMQEGSIEPDEVISLLRQRYQQVRSDVA